MVPVAKRYARSQGHPYDPDRMELFHMLHQALRNRPRTPSSTRRSSRWPTSRTPCRWPRRVRVAPGTSSRGTCLTSGGRRFRRLRREMRLRRCFEGRSTIKRRLTSRGTLVERSARRLDADLGCRCGEVAHVPGDDRRGVGLQRACRDEHVVSLAADHSPPLCPAQRAPGLGCRQMYDRRLARRRGA